VMIICNNIRDRNSKWSRAGPEQHRGGTILEKNKASPANDSSKGAKQPTEKKKKYIMFHNEISEETRGEKRTESNGGESTRGVFWRHVCGYGGRRSARRLRLGREAPQEASKHRKKVLRNSDEDRKMTVMTDV